MSAVSNAKFIRFGNIFKTRKITAQAEITALSICALNLLNAVVCRQICCEVVEFGGKGFKRGTECAEFRGLERNRFAVDDVVVQTLGEPCTRTTEEAFGNGSAVHRVEDLRSVDLSDADKFVVHSIGKIFVNSLSIASRYSWSCESVSGSSNICSRMSLAAFIIE